MAVRTHSRSARTTAQKSRLAHRRRGSKLQKGNALAIANRNRGLCAFRADCLLGSMLRKNSLARKTSLGRLFSLPIPRLGDLQQENKPMTRKLASCVWVPVLSATLIAQQDPQAPAPSPAPATAATDAAQPAPAPASAPSMPQSTPAQSAPSQPPPPDTLLDGTMVKVRITETVTSSDARVGQQVPFEVGDDVLVSGVPVIKKGAGAVGLVTESVPHKAMGPGKLAISVVFLRLVDQERVPLRGDKAAKGSGASGVVGDAALATGTAAIAVAGLIFPPLWVAADPLLMIHGKNNSINQGTEMNAYVNGDLHLNMTNFGGTPTAPPPVGAPAMAEAGGFDAIPAPVSAPADPNEDLPALKDPGIYIKDKTGTWVPMESETVTFKTPPRRSRRSPRYTS